MKSIYCYRPAGLEKGKHSPAREFLDGLSVSAAARYSHHFETRCSGHFLRHNKWHGWEQKNRRCYGIYGYKDIESKTRVVHITDRWKVDILLFGFGGKKENDVEEVHVLRAISLRDEYTKRRDALADGLAASQKRDTRWKR